MSRKGSSVKLVGDFVVMLFGCIVLTSCSQNQKNIPTVGNLDTVAIALDTAMQLGFENSYEFHKTLVVHQNLVFDIIGFGGTATSGEYAILRRGADNKPDTVTKGTREGMIVDAYLADSNKNNREEVYIKLSKPGSDSQQRLIRFEVSTP